MANNGLPPGATLVSGSLPSQSADASTSDTPVSQPSTPGLPPGATLISGTVPTAATPAVPGTTGVSGFLSKVGEGGAEAARDIYGVVKGMVPGGATETGTLKTVWNNLPPVELADSVKQTLPLIHAYEKSRSGGASISDALIAVNTAAKQHSSNISQITPIVDAFKANPTRETARALIDATAAAASLLVGGEAAAPEAEAAATAAKVVPAAEVETPSFVQRFTNPFKKFLQSPKEARAAATQESGSAAVRAVTGTATSEPLVSRAAGTTAADDMLATRGVAKDAAYKKIDDLVGFDRKVEMKKLSDTQYAIKQPGADVPKLQGEIDASTQRLTEADAKLAKAKIDPKDADRLNTSWEATKLFKNDLIQATNTDGTLNVNTLLKRANSRFHPRYGDRLAQAFGKGDVATGKAIAEKYINGLEAAQKAGIKAWQMQRFKLWFSSIAGASLLSGASFEGAKALLQTP